MIDVRILQGDVPSDDWEMAAQIQYLHGFQPDNELDEDVVW